MDESHVKINKWLYPLSFLYGMGVGLRNKLFDWKIFQSKSFDIPVICIGNIAVGGTGKTPHTEYLIQLLKDNFRVAVLSRGYKRKTNGYILADEKSNARTIGDEPYQIKDKFPDIMVAVDANRVHGIEKLNKLIPPLDIILLDDAYQHRYVEAGINILLTEYDRLFCDDTYLPAGRLRESVKGKNRATIVIVTKCPEDMKPIDFNIIAKRLHLYPYQQLYFTSFVYENLVPVFPESGTHLRKLNSLQSSEHILLVTGIASPKAIIGELGKYTWKTDVLTYSDHHDFTKKDIKEISNRFAQLPESKRLIITTEKDATRLVGNPDLPEELKKYIYALPIKVAFLQNQEDTFNQNIISYVRKNKRNSILSKK